MKRKVTKGMLMTALICGTISILPHGVYAEEVAEEEALQGFTLDQIVVTATRTPVTEFDAHANLSVITAKDIELKTNALETYRGEIIKIQDVRANKNEQRAA